MHVLMASHKEDDVKGRTTMRIKANIIAIQITLNIIVRRTNLFIFTLS